MSEELEVYEAPPPATLFGTDDPGEVVAAAARVAQPLADAVERQHLFAEIGRSRHVLVEGWTLLGTMLGVFPITVWTRRIEATDTQPEGWEARVEARTKHGELVGAAEAMCSRGESTWRGRDEYALRSMAQTRATSKALRQPLGFVMTLAGFSATPAEEMPREPAPEEPILDPDGNVFPDQRPATQFAPPKADPYERATKGMWATINKVVARNLATEEDLKNEIYAQYEVTSTKDLRLEDVKAITAALKLRLES